MSQQFNAPRSRANGFAQPSLHSASRPARASTSFDVAPVASAASPAPLHPPALGRRAFGDGREGTRFMQQTNQTKTPALALEGFIDSAKFRWFRGRELTHYWQSTRNGKKNSVPPVELWPNVLRPLAVLDELREFLGYEIVITSSYRSRTYNAAVGGASGSHHLHFRALDFVGRHETPAKWHQALAGMRGDMFGGSNGVPRFRFHGGLGIYKTFVHLDTRGTDADWEG